MECFDQKKRIYRHEKIARTFFVLLDQNPLIKNGLGWRLIRLCTEQGDTLVDDHKYFMCVKCGKKFRNSDDMKKNEDNFKKHKHQTSIATSKQTKLDKFTSSGTSHGPVMREDMLILLCKFVCGSRISFVQASSEAFYTLVWVAMDLARRFPKVDVRKLFVKHSRQSLSVAINMFGKKIKKNYLRLLNNQKVSVVLDGAISLFQLILLSFLKYFSEEIQVCYRIDNEWKNKTYTLLVVHRTHYLRRLL
jgi:hypothetical protein